MAHYLVPGVPAGAARSAFTPHMTRLAASGAQAYKQAVSGQPGTMAVPAPTKDTQLSGDKVTLAWAGTARSSDSPDVWYPQMYYQQCLTERPGAGMPVRVYSDNLMPVPAVDPRGTPARLARKPARRGQNQILQPAVFPGWPASLPVPGPQIGTQ
jgi:hypothetical protein